MVVLLGCLAAHVAMAGLLPSPWWVPDLTLVGLILAISRTPHRWMLLSGSAGLLTAVWAVRFPHVVLVGSLGLGWIVRTLAKQWDITDVRLQRLLVAAASLLTTFGWLWLEGLWSLPVVAFAAMRVLMTSVSVSIVRRVT